MKRLFLSTLLLVLMPLGMVRASSGLPVFRQSQTTIYATPFVGKPKNLAEFRRCEVVQSLWSKKLYTRPKDNDVLKTMALRWALCSLSPKAVLVPDLENKQMTQPLTSYNLDSFPDLNIFNKANAAPFSRFEYYNRSLYSIVRMSDAEWNSIFPGVPKLLDGTQAGHEQALVAKWREKSPQDVELLRSTIHLQSLLDFDRISRIVDENYWKSSAHKAEKAYACCKVCTTGKACGDTCITREDVCHVGIGCACPG